MKFFFDTWQFWITNIITIFIVYFGFWQSKREFKNEFFKMQKARSIEKLDFAFTYATEVLINPKTGSVPTEKDKKELLKFITNIVMYSSNDVVNILSIYQQKNFRGEVTGFDGIIYFALIISQLRFDSTGEWTKPDAIIKLKINDFSERRVEFLNGINRIVKENKFNENLLVSV